MRESFCSCLKGLATIMVNSSHEVAKVLEFQL